MIYINLLTDISIMLLSGYVYLFSNNLSYILISFFIFIICGVSLILICRNLMYVNYAIYEGDELVHVGNRADRTILFKIYGYNGVFKAISDTEGILTTDNTVKAIKLDLVTAREYSKILAKKYITIIRNRIV